jgi:PST family polysaccharide transporter
MEAKGVLDRGQPLIQLGTVLGSSFALAMIPAISAKQLRENTEVVYEKIRSSLAIGFYLAVGATIGLIAIMPEANILLFENQKGTSDLRILIIAILLSALIITAVTILQSLGHIKRTAVFILLTMLVKWIGNQLLVPWIGITGSAFATVISLLLLFFIVALELNRKLPGLAMRHQIKWSSLSLAVFGMLLFIFLTGLFIPADLSRAGAFIYVLVITSVGACIYLFILLRGRTFTEKEISMLPFARAWIEIYKERV